MSIFGPLQKFTRTSVTSGALIRICTRPPLSTRGYCASQTLVEAGRKSPGSLVLPVLATHRHSSARPVRFISALLQVDERCGRCDPPPSESVAPRPGEPTKPRVAGRVASLQKTPPCGGARRPRGLPAWPASPVWNRLRNAHAHPPGRNDSSARRQHLGGGSR